MHWNGTSLDTLGELLDAVVDIARAGDREAAQRFMTAYRAENEHAGENVGYAAGYCDADTAWKIWDLFDVQHPVFGTAVPSAKDAFEAGRRAGETFAASKDGGS